MHSSSAELLFSIHGSAVVFRPSEYVGALHAVERGPCPISQSGFYSLSEFTLQVREGCNVVELITPNYLESLADRHTRRTHEILRLVEQTVRSQETNATDSIPSPYHAHVAFEYGLFATDEMRGKLWHAAHRVYRTIVEKPDAGSTDRRDEKSLRYLHRIRNQFETLCRFMSGDISNTRVDSQTVLYLGRGYFDLPPKPQGEPVIPIPAGQISLF